MNRLLVLSACMASFAALGAFDVREYGAKGDGRTKDTAAIQRAIDAANAAGGGEVFFAPGVYVSGTIYLKSHVDFHLGPGATLLGSPDRADYCTVDAFVQNSAYEKESSVGAHLVLCLEQENVTVRGPGRIDGNSPAFFINPAGGVYGVWGKDGKIPFRPSQMLEFVESRDIRVKDLELKDSTYWTLFIYGCEQVQVTGCWIHNERDRYHTNNGDGIDIDCSRYVTVSDCRIRTADDCITLRASGKRLKHPGDCAYVTVANCTLSTPCNCLRAGVGNGKIHDCVISGITVNDARTAINFVSSWDRNQTDGVDFRNIRISNWTVDCSLLFHLYGGPLAPGVKRVAPMRDIFFTGISGRVTGEPCPGSRTKTVSGSSIRGCSADSPIENLHFRDIAVDTMISTNHVRGITVENSAIRFAK